MTRTEYNHCVDIYSDNIYRFILKHCKDKDWASDVVQDAYVKLWDNVEKISADKAKSYLFATAHHAMIDDIRKQKVYRNFVDFATPTTPHYEYQYSDTLEIVNKLLDQMPSDQKSVLMLRDYEGYSYEDIAEITGLSLSQVKVYIFRARTALKNKLVKMDNLI
ncbi:RNA polymerase sigma factor [Bacteroidia bacterium]|nr:RNA polymerase sigma factor [Bacteroidia bacterium]